MRVDRREDMIRRRPPEDGFVGDVEVAGYFRRDAPSRLAGAFATFGPGARTPWKTNPLGQTIVVIDGVGLVQSAGGDIVNVRAGDLVWWEPGERHWEGAAADRPMSYLAIQEEDDCGVSFGAAVTDAEYRGKGAPKI